VAFRQSRPYVEAQQAMRRRGRNTGAVIGGVIGFVVGAGPVGAAIGAAIGSGAGRSIAADDMSVVRERLLTLIASDVASYFEGYAAAVAQAVSRAADGVLAQLRAARQAHLAQYGDAVARLRSEHELRTNGLARATREARRDADELARRAARLDATLQRLARTGSA